MNHKFMKQKKWNPINKANLEDKWKREKAYQEKIDREKERAKQLKKERSIMAFEEQENGSESKDPLAWMHRLIPNAAKTQRDQMLGKIEIDINNANDFNQTVPGSSVSESTYAISATEAYRRVNEDPLTAIQKKEIEMRKRLRSNPEFLRKIKQIAAEKGIEIPESSKSSRREEKESRHHSSGSHHHSSGSHHHSSRSHHHSSSSRRRSSSSDRNRSRSTSRGRDHSRSRSRPRRTVSRMTEEEKQRRLEEMKRDAESYHKEKCERLLNNREENNEK